MALLTEGQMFARMAVMRGPVVDTNNIFTEMTPAEVDEAYPLSSYASAQYCVQVDGTYVGRADVAPVTDKGIWLDGAFVNEVPDSIMSGFVAGTPGSGPAWHFYNVPVTARAAETALGLPGGVFTRGPSSTYAHSSFPGGKSAQAAEWSTSAVVKSTGGNVKLYTIKNGAGAGSYEKTAGGWARVSVIANASLVSGDGSTADIELNPSGTSYGVAGWQLIYGLKLVPNVLALSSAATTAKPATIIQREVDLRGPFAVEINATTAPGDPGFWQQLLCLSKDSGNRINVARYPATNRVTVQSRVNASPTGTAGTIVGHNAQTVVRMQVEFNRCRVSVDGDASATISKARADNYILNSLGVDFNGTSSWWGSIQSFRILENYIATDDELENGFAI